MKPTLSGRAVMTLVALVAGSLLFAPQVHGAPGGWSTRSGWLPLHCIEAELFARGPSLVLACAAMPAAGHELETTLLRSGDEGATWRTLAVRSRTHPFAIARSDSAWLAVDDQGRAALSRDLGVTWQEAVGVRQRRCGAVAGRGETLALTCDGRVFQLDTADEHARWRALPSLGARVTPGQVAVTRAGVFATMTDPDAYALETVHRFDKATRRWREVAVGRLLPASADAIAVRRGPVLAISFDAGRSWGELDVAAAEDPAVAGEGSFLVVATRWHGLYVSGDRGGSWRAVAIPASDGDLAGIGVFDGELFAVKGMRLYSQRLVDLVRPPIPVSPERVELSN